MSFKSTKEIYQTLIEGKSVQDTYKNVVCLDNGGNQCVKNGAGMLCKDVAYKFDQPSEWQIYEKQINISIADFRTIFFSVVGPNYKKEIFEKVLADINDRGCIK